MIDHFCALLSCREFGLSPLHTTARRKRTSLSSVSVCLINMHMPDYIIVNIFVQVVVQVHYTDRTKSFTVQESLVLMPLGRSLGRNYAASIAQHASRTKKSANTFYQR